MDILYGAAVLAVGFAAAYWMTYKSDRLIGKTHRESRGNALVAAVATVIGVGLIPLVC